MPDPCQTLSNRPLTGSAPPHVWVDGNDGPIRPWAVTFRRAALSQGSDIRIVVCARLADRTAGHAVPRSVRTPRGTAHAVCIPWVDDEITDADHACLGGRRRRRRGLLEDLSQIGIHPEPHAGLAGILGGALGGRGPPGPGDRGLESQDGVIVEARQVDDEQAGFGHVRFSDRVHVCQYVFVDARGSVQTPDSPDRVSCQWRRLPFLA